VVRQAIPKKIRDALLDEYDHRCAVCAGDRPQVHHIDEDPSNNDLLNLLPLCPNCHLRDQHNPTRRVEVPKLQLFRKYRDPAILKPQFHPVYARQLFLHDVELSEEPVAPLEAKVQELIELVQALEMGQFYAKRLSELLGPLKRIRVMSLGGVPDPTFEMKIRVDRKDYRSKLIANREQACALLVEMLRYQAWANVA
jgi:hypothetical protein